MDLFAHTLPVSLFERVFRIKTDKYLRGSFCRRFVSKSIFYSVALYAHFFLDSIRHYDSSPPKGLPMVEYLAWKGIPDLIILLCVLPLLVTKVIDWRAMYQSKLALAGGFVTMIPDIITQFLPNRGWLHYVYRLHSYCHFPRNAPFVVGMITQLTVVFISIFALTYIYRNKQAIYAQPIKASIKS